MMISRLTVESWLESQSERCAWWLGILGVVMCLELAPFWPLAPDAVDYLSIARSLATGRGLRNLGFAHIAYPPGYPLLISPAFLFPAPFVIIVGIHWLLSILLAIGLYCWFRRHADSAALLLTALVMVNVSLWIYSRVAISELSFMTIAVWTVISLNSAMEATPGSRFRRILLATALLLLLGMTREVGVLFAVGFLVIICVKLSRGRLLISEGMLMALPVGLISFVGLAAFLIYDEHTYHSAHVFGTHLAGFFDRTVPVRDRLLDGFHLQINALGRLIVPGMFKAYGKQGIDINLIIYSIVCVVLGVGWFRCCRQWNDVYVVTVPLYLTLYVVWSFDSGTRYLLPVLPVLCLSLWRLVEPYSSCRLTILSALVVLHLCVAIGYTIFMDIPTGRQCAKEWAPMARMAQIIATEDGRIAALHGTPECSNLVLSYISDRPVAKQDMNASSLFDQEWLIAPADPLQIEGFVTEYGDGEVRLLRRTVRK